MQLLFDLKIIIILSDTLFLVLLGLSLKRNVIEAKSDLRSVTFKGGKHYK